MRLVNTIVIASAAAFLAGGLAMTGTAHGDDAAATTKPTTQKAKSTKLIKLVQPWSKVTDLTDDQKQQLFDIHEDFKAKMKALEAEEEEKCNAVLTDAQKAQLGETLDAAKADKKAKAAEQRAAEKASKAAN